MLITISVSPLMLFVLTLSLVTTINLISINIVPMKHESTSNFRLSSKHGFKIASLNVNSLSAHIYEVIILLDDKFLDVLAIHETKLNNSQRDSEFYIPGFDLVRRDRISDGGGGVCFYTVFTRIDAAPE